MRGVQYMSSVVETMTRKSLAEMDPGGTAAGGFLTEDSSSFTTSGLSGGTYTRAHRQRGKQGYIRPIWDDDIFSTWIPANVLRYQELLEAG